MKPDFEQHIEESSLELYALGQLDEAHTEVLEEHILICEPCRVRLDEEDRYVRAMNLASARLRHEAENAPAGILDLVQNWLRMPTPAWGAVAMAACLLLVVTTATLRHRSPVDDTPVTVEMTALRGEAVTAPAQHPLDLKLNAEGLTLGSDLRAEVVPAQGGAAVEQDVASRHGSTVEVKTHEHLAKGSYLIRLYNGHASDSVREYALDLK